jgi:predicted glycosyltransferase
MDKEKLREQLQALHSELQQVETLDAKEREMLQGLARDIQEVLHAEDDRNQPYGPLSDRLRETVAQVEASHPRATMLMRQIIDQLAYMGI